MQPALQLHTLAACSWSSELSRHAGQCKLQYTQAAASRGMCCSRPPATATSPTEMHMKSRRWLGERPPASSSILLPAVWVAVCTASATVHFNCLPISAGPRGGLVLSTGLSAASFTAWGRCRLACCADGLEGVQDQAKKQQQSHNSGESEPGVVVSTVGGLALRSRASWLCSRST